MTAASLYIYIYIYIMPRFFFEKKTILGFMKINASRMITISVIYIHTYKLVKNTVKKEDIRFLQLNFLNFKKKINIHKIIKELNYGKK